MHVSNLKFKHVRDVLWREKIGRIFISLIQNSEAQNSFPMTLSPLHTLIE